MSIFKLWWHRLTTKRTKIELVHYSLADKYLAEGWEIAKEEDTNQNYGFVYLELRE